MGKGKQVAADTTQRTTNLPEYADPYFRRLLQGAEEALMPFDPETGQTTYRPYPDERIAPSSMYGDIQGSRAMTRGIAQSGIAGMPQAMGASQAAMDIQSEALGGLRGLADYQTGDFSAYDPTRYGGFQQSQYGQFGFQQPEQFSSQYAQQYMSPYMDAVVEQQKRGARKDFERTQASRDAAAAQSGAFGGSRQAVGQYLAEEGLADQLGGIEATGRQRAFEQAAQQFGLDRAARMEAEARQAAELGRVQAGRAGEMGRVQAARAAEQSRLDALRAAELARVQQGIEQSRQFGAGQGLAAYQAIGSGASNLAGLGAGLASLGERQRAADIQGAQLLEAVGRDIRAEDQGRLDLAYEDFLRQRDYPITQYERMAGILRGVPVTPNVEQTRFANYNPIQQALGAGISALGLYKGLAA